MGQKLIRNVSKNGEGWYWEVLDENGIIARGLADKEQQAEEEAVKAELAFSGTAIAPAH